MKSKLKYYAQVIGVNLLAFLVPVLAVVLIYGLGKLSLEHVRRYAEEEKAAGVHGELSPKLLPVYTHGRDVR